MLIGLGVHSFIEGMPLANPHHHSHMHSSLLTAIVLHKIPVGIVLTHMLIESKMSKPKIIILISLFAITTPLGTFFSEYISNISNYFREIMAIVTGMFLHISTTILFESSEGHHFNSRKAIAIIIGSSIALISTFL